MHIWGVNKLKIMLVYNKLSQIRMKIFMVRSMESGVRNAEDLGFRIEGLVDNRLY